MDRSEANFILPTEIIFHIVSFMDARTKRQMRATNAAWFKWIHQTNFTFYVSNVDVLPAIIDRLSKYNGPIGVKFAKPFRSKMDPLGTHLPKLTNLTYLSYHDARYSNMSEVDWMRLTVLTNLESWKAPHYCPQQVIAKLHSLTKLKIHSPSALALFNGELPKFTKLLSLAVDHRSPAEDLDLSLLTKKITKLIISTGISGRGILTLTNLKNLHYYQHDYVPPEPLPIHQLSKLESLQILQKNGLTVARFPRNITKLVINAKDMIPECQAGLAQLRNIKTLRIAEVRGPDTVYQYLTAMTALEYFQLWPSTDRTANALPQTTGACLSYLRSDKLTTLSLGITPFMTCLEYLSELDSLEELIIDEHSTKEAKINYDSISGLTRLTTLTVKTCAIRPSLICVTNLDLLKHLTIDISTFNVLCVPPGESLKYRAGRVTLDDSFILSRLSNLQQLALHYCTRATIESIKSTNLQALRAPFLLPDIDYSFLASMKLTSLHGMQSQADNESFWNIIPKLTDLRTLDLQGIGSDDGTVGWTSMQHLTQLCLRDADPKFTGEHLTLLTTLQRLIVRTRVPNAFKRDEILQKMPNLNHNIN